MTKSQTKVKGKAKASKWLPKVTVITPFHRVEDMMNVNMNTNRQDYEGEVEYIIVCDKKASLARFTSPKVKVILCEDGTLLGVKRNMAVMAGDGDVIVHMDADDKYSKTWISDSVNALSDSKFDMTGVNCCEFHDVVNKKVYEYKWRGSMGYVVGATMAYRRSLYDKVGGFPEIPKYEDTEFIKKVSSFRIVARSEGGFTAIIHGKNTASHEVLGTMRFVRDL